MSAEDELPEISEKVARLYTNHIYVHSPARGLSTPEYETALERAGLALPVHVMSVQAEGCSVADLIAAATRAAEHFAEGRAMNRELGLEDDLANAFVLPGGGHATEKHLRAVLAACPICGGMW